MYEDQPRFAEYRLAFPGPGPAVDHDALFAALNSRRIASAGLDCL